MGQRRVKAGDADREPCRGHGLRPEARDEAIVASAAADRTEANCLSALIRGREGQVRFQDRAGVIFEPANDGCIEADAVLAVARLSRTSSIIVLTVVSAGTSVPESKRQDGIRLLRGKLRPRREVAALVLAAFAQQLGHALKTEPVELIHSPEHNKALPRGP